LREFFDFNSGFECSAEERGVFFAFISPDFHAIECRGALTPNLQADP